MKTMLFTKTEKHLWTEIEIQIVSENPETEKVIEDIFLYCEDFESEFSRFRPESELSLVNKEKKRTISERFKKLFELSLKYYEQTNGYFSPFVQVSQLWYSHSFDSWVFEKTSSSHWDTFYKLEWNTLSLWTDTTLDFWWIGKWFLVDEITKKLDDFWYKNFCINAWGDLFVRGKSDQNFAWGIWVEDPLDGQNCAVFYCQDCAVNTSGWYRRKWNIQNQEYHHLINPATWENTNNYLSVSVLTNSSAYADVLTKVLWHTPQEELKNFFEKYRVDGILITKKNDFILSKNMETRYMFRELEK